MKIFGFEQNLDSLKARTTAQLQPSLMFDDTSIFSQKENANSLETFSVAEHSLFSSVQLKNPIKKGKIIKNLPKLLAQKDVTQMSKNEVISYIKSIDKSNFQDIMRNTETSMGVNPLITLIQDTTQLNDKEKVDAMKYLLQQGTEYASKKGIYTEDFMAQLSQNIDKYDNSMPKIQKKAIVSDFRKLVDRKAPDKTAGKTNGEVDKPSRQGKAGDCWLLSAINSMASSSKGREILNKSISKDAKTGDITVTLKGLDKPIVITQDELMRNNNYSTGDGDVRAIEIAVDKYFRENSLNGKTDIYGNTSNVGLVLLAGVDSPTMFESGREGLENVLSQMSERGSDNVIAVTAVTQKRDMSGCTGEAGTSTISISSAHAYSITKVDDKSVYLIDPANSGETIRLDKSTYLAYFDNISYIDLSEQ